MIQRVSTFLTKCTWIHGQCLWTLIGNNSYIIHSWFHFMAHSAMPDPALCPTVINQLPRGRPHNAKSDSNLINWISRQIWKMALVYEWRDWEGFIYEFNLRSQILCDCPFKYYQNSGPGTLGPNTKELFVSYILNAMSLHKKNWKMPFLILSFYPKFLC